MNTRPRETSSIGDALRRLADEVIGPIGGGYLRPWMCSGDPAACRVLLVGANPATPFPADGLTRERYLDALVNDDPFQREHYLALRGGTPSPTRRTIDRLVSVLRGRGVAPVLETNVWTLPTRDLAALRHADRAVVAASATVVPRLIELLTPPVILVHGAAATRGLAAVLGRDLPVASVAAPVLWTQGRPAIVAIPSLSPPAANRWLPAGWVLLERLAADVAERVALAE